MLALYGVGALITTVIAALALVLPVWAAALIVAVVIFIVAGVLGLLGKNQIQRAAPPGAGEHRRERQARRRHREREDQALTNTEKSPEELRAELAAKQRRARRHRRGSPTASTSRRR